MSFGTPCGSNFIHPSYPNPNGGCGGFQTNFFPVPYNPQSGRPQMNSNSRPHFQSGGHHMTFDDRRQSQSGGHQVNSKFRSNSSTTCSRPNSYVHETCQNGKRCLHFLQGLRNVRSRGCTFKHTRDEMQHMQFVLLPELDRRGQELLDELRSEEDAKKAIRVSASNSSSEHFQ